MTDMSTDPGVSGRLVSGEAVELDVRVARVGSRVFAFALDIVINAGVTAVTVVVALMTLAGAVPRVFVDDALFVAVTTAAVVVMMVVFPATIETLSRGRSVGKAMMGLRVVRDDGGPIRFRHALLRSAAAFFVEFPGVLLPGFTWFAMLAVTLIHPSAKRFGDLMAGTIVIHERTPRERVWVPVMPYGLAGWAAVVDLAGLDDELALAVRHFLARNHEIREPARSRLGGMLEAELRQVVVPPPPPGTPGWAFLAAVLAERYRRASQRLATNRSITAQVWRTLYGPDRGTPNWIRPESLPPGTPPGRTLPVGPPPQLSIVDFTVLSQSLAVGKSCVTVATIPR